MAFKGHGMYHVRPNDFYSETPPPRIIGTESECSIQNPNNTPIHDYISRKSLRNSGLNTVGGFLDNGFKVYVDVGFLEIDTPECLGPKQAAAADYAAILLLGKIVEQSGKPHDGLYRFTGTMIAEDIKTNGYHENLMIPRSIAENEQLDTVFASHLASRVWSFAGGVQDNFCLSQKIKGIIEPSIERHNLSRRTANKPMAMIPPNDEDTIGNTNDWARLEIRFADTGFSLTGRYLSLAASSLAVRLLEHQDLINAERIIDYSFKKQVVSANVFSRDLSFKKTVPTLEGKSISALDYQEVLASEAQALSYKIELPDDEVDAIGLWIDVIDRLRQADLSIGEYAGLLSVLDFAPRHKYLTTRFPEELIHSGNNDVITANLLWDRVSPIGGGMKYWRAVGSKYVSEDDVAQVLTTPPRTRASIRANIIKSDGLSKLEAANWSCIYRNGFKINFDSPYNSYSPPLC